MALTDDAKIKFAGVNKEIDKLVADVECYQDLTVQDYVNYIRSTKAWKDIKAEDAMIQKIAGDKTLKETGVGLYDVFLMDLNGEIKLQTMLTRKVRVDGVAGGNK